jgi:hypothetical protein
LLLPCAFVCSVILTDLLYKVISRVFGPNGWVQGFCEVFLGIVALVEVGTAIAPHKKKTVNISLLIAAGVVLAIGVGVSVWIEHRKAPYSTAPVVWSWSTGNLVGHSSARLIVDDPASSYPTWYFVALGVAALIFLGVRLSRKYRKSDEDAR